MTRPLPSEYEALAVPAAIKPGGAKDKRGAPPEEQP